jgi:hypothetical protein
MQPDMIWLKDRSVVSNHTINDSVRGSSVYVYPNLTNAEATNANYLTSFNSNGFSLGSANYTNGEAIVGWQWKANGTPAVTNTAGSITSTVSASTTSGFSVVTYTGTGTTATVGHGLGVAPKLLIIKSRNATANWQVLTTATGSWRYGYLNLTNAFNPPGESQPTSTVFGVTNTAENGSNGVTYVAYCFAEIAGFSKFGSYTGNGSSDGPMIFTGFRPRFILLKRTDTTGNWNMYDSARSPRNADTKVLYPNLSNSEDASTDHFDWLSNGFKMKSTNQNTNGGTFIYVAFAENPFKYSLAQ